MKFLIVFFMLIASSLAHSYFLAIPASQLQQLQPLQKTTTASIGQYFKQDSLGQYSYGYTEPLSSKQEQRDINGVTKGFYSYVDANGQLQSVDYIADTNGFRVAATNLPIANNEAPQPVTDTPEVVAAREQHLAAHRAAVNGDLRLATSSHLPQPVKDTVEVTAAKNEFFARFAAEEQKHKLLQSSALLKSQGLIVTSLPLFFQKNSKLPVATLRAPHLSPSATTALNYGYQLKAANVKPSNFYLPVA